MKIRSSLQTITCFLFILSASALAAPGDFDPSFGYGGAMQFGTPYRFYFEGPANEDPPHCCVLAQQADGKLLMAGATDETYPRLVLRRFNTNGTLDTSYGFKGEALGSFVYPGSFAYGIPTSLQSLSNGKTIVAGSAWSQGVKVFVVQRFTSGGDLDTTFGTDGVITRPYDNAAVSLAEYRGTIYAASNRRIYCINTDGSACVGFGFGHAGYITVAPSISRVAIQPVTNRLLAAGDGWVRRYALDGQVDTSFGNNGIASVCRPSCDYCARRTDMAVQPNGKVTTSATVIEGSIGFAHYFTLGRLNSNGSADLTFGGNGCSGDEYSFPPFATPGTPRGLEIQTDGKIVILEGPTTPYYASPDGNWLVSRFNADGSRDNGFQAQGTLDRNQDVLIQADGKIVTVGSTYSSSTDSLSNIFLGRYLP